MAEYESRKKRWILERKMLVLALCVLICVPSTKGISTDLGDVSLDSWEFALSANSKQIKYDFCKYNGTSTGMQCKNLMSASIDFEKVCNCTIIQHDETNDGSLSFDLGCKSNLTYCPEELTVTYRQGSNATAPHQVPSRRGIGDDNNESPGNPPGPGTGADAEVATSGITVCLAVVSTISIAVNVLVIYRCREKVLADWYEMWNRLPNRSEQPDLNVNQPNPTGLGRNVIESTRIPQRFNLGQSGLETGEHSDSDSSESDLLNTSKKRSRNIEVDKSAKTKFKDTSLLLAGAKPLESADSTDKRTALHYLAAQDEPDPVKIQTLLKNGADVNARDQEGLTALHLAAWRNKNAEIVKILLEKGANVNAPNNDSVSALHFAARFNPASEIVQMLLENGADVDTQTQYGLTALHLAAGWNEKPELVKILVENGAKVNAQDNKNWTALHLAARYNPASEIVQMLLKNGADIHSQTQYGSTALNLAAGWNKNPELVKILLEKGAKVNARNNDSVSALHLAARFNPGSEIVQMLLEYGANVDLKTPDGLTALHLAAGWNEKPELVKILLERGAKVNAQDIYKRTALHYAAKNKEITEEVFQQLIEHGADVDTQDRKGLTPLDLARSNENPGTVKILLEATKMNATAMKKNL